MGNDMHLATYVQGIWKQIDRDKDRDEVWMKVFFIDWQQYLNRSAEIHHSQDHELKWCPTITLNII